MEPFIELQNTPKAVNDAHITINIAGKMDPWRINTFSSKKYCREALDYDLHGNAYHKKQESAPDHQTPSKND